MNEYSGLTAMEIWKLRLAKNRKLRNKEQEIKAWVKTSNVISKLEILWIKHVYGSVC